MFIRTCVAHKMKKVPTNSFNEIEIAEMSEQAQVKENKQDKEAIEEEFATFLDEDTIE